MKKNEFKKKSIGMLRENFNRLKESGDITSSEMDALDKAIRICNFYSTLQKLKDNIQKLYKEFYSIIFTIPGMLKSPYTKITHKNSCQIFWENDYIEIGVFFEEDIAFYFIEEEGEEPINGTFVFTQSKAFRLIEQTLKDNFQQ